MDKIAQVNQFKIDRASFKVLGYGLNRVALSVDGEYYIVWTVAGKYVERTVFTTLGETCMVKGYIVYQP